MQLTFGVCEGDWPGEAGLAHCNEVVKGDEVDAMAGFECLECQSDSQVGCSVC